MSKTSVITARIDPEQAAKLDMLAAKTERSRAWIAARAINRYVEEELKFLAFLQEGVDAADCGDTFTQEAVEAMFAVPRGKHDAA